jgi:hypothetical protein
MDRFDGLISSDCMICTEDMICTEVDPRGAGCTAGPSKALSDLHADLYQCPHRP